MSYGESLHDHADPTFDQAAWMELQQMRCAACTNRVSFSGKVACGIGLKFPSCTSPRGQHRLPENPTKQQREESGFNLDVGATA